MRYKTIILIIILLCNFYSIVGQKKLIVKDSETLETLVNAQVIFSLNKDLKNFKGGITGKKGEINIPFAQTCYYKALFIGYETEKGIIHSDNKDLTILLSPSNYEFDQVVVTGSRSPRPIKSSPVVTQVISASRLSQSGFSNIQNALMQEIPGLNFQKVGFGTDINVSGLDARHILFLIDGERLTGEMAGNLDYQRFNLHGIQRIEIVKGASSTLYGSRAAGAVINLITKKTTKGFEAKAGVRYGQANQRNYDNPRKSDFLYMYEKNVDKPNLQSWLSLGTNKGKFTSQTDILYSSTDAFYLFQSGRDIKKFSADKSIGLMRDTTVTSGLARPPLGIEGSEHINLSQKLYYKATENLEIKLYGSLFFLNTYDLLQDLQFSQAKDVSGGIKTNYNFGAYASAVLSIHTDYYNRYKRQERVDTRDVVYDSKILQPRFIITSNYYENHRFSLGIDYYQDKLTSDRFKNNKLTEHTKKDVEYFLQDEYKFTDKLTIVGGFRSSFNENYGTNISPKLAVKYSPIDPISIRFNYAAGYRSPSIKELYFNWDHLGMFQIVGDEFLQPEKNNYYSLSGQYTTPAIFLSTNIYANYFRDKIEGVWQIYDFQYNFEYKNLSKSSIAGIEMMGRIKLCNPLRLDLSYSYVKVKEIDGIQTNTTSPHTGSIRLGYKYKRRNYRLTSNISMSITGQKEFSVQDKLVIDGKSHDAYFNVKTPAYSMCNLSVTQKFKNCVELTIGADNFLNYKPKILGSGVTMFNIPATAGRRFFVQMDLTLDRIKNLFND